MSYKTELHKQTGPEKWLSPYYCVIQSKDDWVFSGRDNHVLVTLKPVKMKTKTRNVNAMHIHIRLTATEGKQHRKLDKPVVFDIDCYVMKEHFEDQLRELIPHQKTLLDR